MSNLIDRDELYKALAQWDWQDLYLPVHFKELVDEIPVVRHSYEDGVRKGYEDAVLHYAKMALKQWIPVSERLPEVDEEVLVYLWGDCPHLAWVNKNGQWETEHFFLDKDDAPNAWMPLPEPYKGGDAE